MVVNLDRLFSARSEKLKASEIRELLKITQVPGMISLAGGLPNPKSFPVKAMKKCIDDIFENDIAQALQYGTTEGLPSLRAEIANRMRRIKNIDCTKDNILITHGSQQGLSLISHALIDPGDTIIVGAPTYLGAIQSFRAYEAKCESIPLEMDGFNIERLIRNIKRLKRNGIHPKFIYTVPTYQNPSGITMSVNKRKNLLDVASAYDMLIVEDDPYGELTFDGEAPPSIKTFDTKGRVIYLGTFSKILAPGFRLAWIIASDRLLNKFCLVKQSMDLCSNSFGQYVAFKYINGGYLDEQLKKTIELYSEKQKIMLNAINEHFPDDVKWTIPKGGMFLWVTLPAGMNARSMFKRAISNQVAYVVGDAFFSDGAQKETFRLNFSYSTNENIEEGIKRLGKVIREEQEMSLCDKDLTLAGV